jgi:uncharacterized phage infection (PIP) family protein YhgE
MKKKSIETMKNSVLEQINIIRRNGVELLEQREAFTREFQEKVDSIKRKANQVKSNIRNVNRKIDTVESNNSEIVDLRERIDEANQMLQLKDQEIATLHADIKKAMDEDIFRIGELIEANKRLGHEIVVYRKNLVKALQQMNAASNDIDALPLQVTEEMAQLSQSITATLNRIKEVIKKRRAVNDGYISSDDEYDYEYDDEDNVPMRSSESNEVSSSSKGNKSKKTRTGVELDEQLPPYEEEGGGRRKSRKQTKRRVRKSSKRGRKRPVSKSKKKRGSL